MPSILSCEIEVSKLLLKAGEEGLVTVDHSVDGLLLSEDIVEVADVFFRRKSRHVLRLHLHISLLTFLSIMASQSMSLNHA